MSASRGDRSARTRRSCSTKLVEFNLLNGYQASRIRAGKEFGLVLGNYRVLDRIGAGGMGVIYLAEQSGCGGGSRSRR